MNILCITNNTASHLWRLTPYLEYAKKQGNGVIMHNVGENLSEIETIWADVVICEMILEKKIVDMCHKSGATVIYEIDDVIEKVTKNHPHFVNMTRWNNWVRTYRTIHASDALFASNEILAKRYGRVSKDVFVVPNLVDLNYWLKPPNPNTSDSIRIGWAGSFAHYDDLKFFQPVIKRILDKYPKTKFIYVGMGGWHGASRHPK